ncbi:MAG: hypothetical protein MUO76_11810 [Anaerolineaceae bacterium]|nr:hypothetical protein [Anaerolineaceae bacterium]
MKKLNAIRKIRSLEFPPWTIMVAILGICVAAYGLLISRLGFYWDDWEIILVIQQYDLSEFWAYFSGHRPLAGWTYLVFAPILGTSPIYWQIFTLLLRYLSVLAMWVMFASLWPKRKREITLSAILFAVYPIFIQQPIAVSYHQHWLAFLLYFLSMIGMIYSIKKKAYYWVFTLLSVAAIPLHATILEYFLGVELLRPLVLWFLLGKEKNGWWNRFKATLKYWIPYGIVLGSFVAWRLYYASQSVLDDPNRPELLFQLISTPLNTLLHLFRMALGDSIFILLFSWTKTLRQEFLQFSSFSALLFWGTAILTVVGLVFYLLRLKFTDQEANVSDENESEWFRQAMVLSILSIILGTLPIWVTGRQVYLETLNSDRFAMVSMFGASLFWVTLLSWLSDKWKRKVIVFSIFVVLAVNLQLNTANDYRWSWTLQERTYWELYWRAPWIEPQTAIVTDGYLFPYVFPTFSLNVLYSQPQDSRQLSYWAYLVREVDYELDSWKRNEPLNANHREFTFTGFGRDMILLQKSGFSNCLWILKPDDENTPYLSDQTRRVLPLSNLSRISPTPGSATYPDANIFGEEPEKGWCYFYQKAELALQMKDWSEIVRLGEQAIESGYSPTIQGSNSPHEWLPFIEGYANFRGWEQAKEITIASFYDDENYRSTLCDLWKKISLETETDTEQKIALDEVFSVLECSR